MGVFVVIILVLVLAFLAGMFYSKSKGTDHIGLDADEEVILRGKPHWGMLIPSGLGTLISFIIVMSTYRGLYSISEAQLVWIGVFVVALISLGLDVVRFLLTDLTITNKRIFGKSIVFRVMKVDAPIRHLSFVMIFQGIIGRIFGFGKLCVTVTGGRTLTFPGMVDPDTFRKLLMTTIDKFEQEKSRQHAAEIAAALAGMLGRTSG